MLTAQQHCTHLQLHYTQVTVTRTRLFAIWRRLRFVVLQYSLVKSIVVCEPCRERDRGIVPG